MFVLRKGAALLALAFIAGCGSAEKAAEPEPAERHLVYEKLIGDKGIWIADVDGSLPRRLVPRGDLPAISPDGTWVTYSGECSESDTSACDTLYIVSTSDTDKPRRLSTVVSGTITWSQDSKRVVGESRGRLLSIEVESGKSVEVAEGSFSGWSISPDGDQIVFAREEKPGGNLMSGFDVDLFVSDLDGGEPKRITESHDAAYPVWGPKSIAFSKLISCHGAPGRPPTGCMNNTWGRHEIWRVEPDGSDRRPIVSPLPKRFHGQGYIGLVPLDWSEDGRALLAGLLNEWGRSPLAVDPETGDVRELARDQASEGLALSRDGEMALVEMIDNVGSYPESNNVLIAPYAGGKARVVAHGATGASWNR
jgi:Tol biopolymer transport system component